ncbi:MAG: sigma-70 family RNA polymerase sigma factor [Lachnospiraceae bacterium]|nr:sigma-70 family RNA polymerase sigma factor [Lachnospiraceae bacterium]
MTNEQLVTLIKNKMDVADNMLKLWQQNIKFIGKIAGSYRGYEDIEDLKQQGYIGLCDAVEGYRAEEGIPFINYASFWIRQSMTRYIENCGGVVRIPVHERQRQRKYKKLLHDFEARTGRKPTDWEICRSMQISSKVLEEMRNNAGMEQIGSLDNVIGEDSDTTIGDLVPGDADVEGTVLDHIEQEELSNVLWSVVDTLPGNQPQVLRCMYQEGKTLKATGEAVGGITCKGDKAESVQGTAQAFPEQ